MSFATSLARALGEAGATYVLLSDGGNDVDLVVDRASLRVTEEVVRRQGTLVQVQEHDIPYSRAYVVRTDEPGRRYRRIDVVCDPWGIGRYGTSTRTALERAVAGDDCVRRPDAAALLCYLTCKRALKGATDEQAAELEALGHVAGEDGRALLARPARRHLAAPLLAPAFRARRAVRRALRPTGVALCLAGPDGVGKSTITQRLLELRGGPFVGTVRLGQRRGFFRKPGQLLGRPAGDPSEPHARPPSSTAGSFARLAYLWLDALVGWPIKVASPRRRSRLLVLERGLLDMAIDPRRYRLSTPPALARAFARLLPQPDATLALTADAELVRARKPELAPREIERQLDLWRAEARTGRVALLDASGSPETTYEAALDAVDRVLAHRFGDLGAARTAFELLGPPASGGEAFRVTRRHGGVRYVVPASARKGPAGTGLYRPARGRDGIAALALEGAHRLGLVHTVLLDPDRGAAPAIARALGLARVHLSAAAARDGARGGRAVLTVHEGRKLVAYAKAVERAHSTLGRELAALDALDARATQTIAAPRPLGLLEVGPYDVLLLEPVLFHGRPHRPIGPRELDALAELAPLSLVPHSPGEVTVHGDFTAFNTGLTGDGRVAVVDWERAGPGLPLEDLFHWRVQELVLFGSGSAEEIVEAALRPDPQVRELATRVGVDPGLAPAALLRSVTRRDDPAELPAREVVCARIHELLAVS